jgi:hypothetical protein
MIDEIKQEIGNLITFLLEKELILDFNYPIKRTVGDIDLLTWAGAPQSGIISRGFASIPEYISVVSKRNFNLVLKDGGAIQFGYAFKNLKVIKQRICYFPCPAKITDEDIEGIPNGDDFVALLTLLLELEMQEMMEHLRVDRLSEMPVRFYNRSPIRFDFDPDRKTVLHSASHFHVNESSCRLPVFGPISIGHFVRFVFKSFYPDWWSEYEELRKWPITFYETTIDSQNIQELHFSSIKPVA